MKKITRATFKSFLNKNKGNLFIKEISTFDGMIDGVNYHYKPQFTVLRANEEGFGHEECDLGYAGIWLTRSDLFKAYEDEEFQGIYVYNCCGSFVVAVKKQVTEAA